MRCLLTIAICFFIAETASAQLNHRLIDSNATWCTLSGNFIGGPPPPYTIDAGRAQFDSVFIDSLGRFVSIPNYQYSEYIFIEDSGQHVVHAVTGADTMLLYDMNLQVGDTFHWHPRMADTVNHIWLMDFLDDDTVTSAFSVLTSLDTVVLTDSTWRWRWTFKNWLRTSSDEVIRHFVQEMQWIDGIGATLGWYYPIHGTYFESWDYFTAYFYDDNLLLKWGECHPVGIDDTPTPTQGIRIWPNPVEDQVFIEAPSALQSLSVVNQVGLRVMYTSFHGAATSTTLDLHSLPIGYYHILTETEQGTTSTPLVKVQ